MKELLRKNKHVFVLLYVIVYFIWFFTLENRSAANHYIVYCKIDDYIPFNELFVIPYILWFAYICIVVLYLMLTSVKDFYKCTAFLFIGMTICLIIYTFWPNAQNLRVTSFERNNIFTQLVNWFYSNDTPTNVCPSIHVYNSIGAHIALMHCEKTKKNKLVMTASWILMISICLSTMFIKQHSFVDFSCAIILAAVMYLAVYKINYKKLFQKK